MLPLHCVPGRHLTLLVGKRLIAMEHHDVQSLRGQEQLGVQPSSTAAVPDGELAKISLSCSDVCFPKSPGLFPSAQPVLNLYVESGSHRQAQWCLESSLRHWPVSAGLATADSSADVNISIKAVKYSLSHRVQAWVCLKLLVRSSSNSFCCFRPWFSAVYWQVGLNMLLVLHQGLFPPGCFLPDQRGQFKL